MATILVENPDLATTQTNILNTLTYTPNPDITTTQKNILDTIQSSPVSSPGVSGPLSTLDGTQYDLVNLKYPQDLNDSTKSHSVQFEIYKINPIPVDQIASNIGELGSSVLENIINPVNLIDQTTEVLNNLKNDPMKTITSGGEKLSAQIQKLSSLSVETTSSGSIRLYMPETLNFNYNAQYGSLSIAKAASSISGIASGITSVLDNDAVRLALSSAGYVFNPQSQLLFEGISFREFNMSFTFTPFSQSESETIKDIIKTFRKYAAPSINRGAAGFFYTPPAQFQIKFFQSGDENLFINRLEKCVLKNVDVNYAPNGWSAYRDGAPVQTTLTLGFEEIVLIDRDKVEQGY